MKNCLIVDDEPIARDIIAAYCSNLPMLNVVGSVANAFDAKAILTNEAVDILFLDINMPVLDGVSFLKTLRNPPQVIFTTAYKEFATDAFDLAACDYLLKPFSLDRFMIAVDKAIEKLDSVKINQPITTHKPAAEDFFFIKTEGKIYNVRFSDLLFAEANGNYTKIVTVNGVLMPVMTFSTIVELLPPDIFLQLHRSFIVNKGKISRIEGNRVFVNDMELPIGSNFRDAFLRELGV